MFCVPNWGFRNTVHAYHSDDSIKLPLKSVTGSSKSEDESGKISLDEFVRTRVPSIKDGAKFNLKPTLFNGVLQTLYTFKADFHKKFPVYYGREIIEITEHEANDKLNYKHLHPGSFTLDYVVKPSDEEFNDYDVFKQRCKETLPEGYPKLHPRCRYYDTNELDALRDTWSTNDQPITIIVPGLAGGIQEAPIRSTCHKLQKQGHNVVVLNQRGCSRSVITTPYLYTGLETDDLKYIINRFIKLYGDHRQIHVIGYSFGGLQLANYCIKEGKNSKITSAISISSPWDLNESMQKMKYTYSGNYLFAPTVSFFLLRMVKSNMSVLSQHPEIFNQEKYDNLKKRIKYPTEFDDEFTCKQINEPTAKMYYYKASPIQKIFDIKTPFLVINSSDDPMISADYPTVEVKQHPYIYMATTDLGGHYSFIDSAGDFWFGDVVTDWIEGWKEVDVVSTQDIS